MKFLITVVAILTLNGYLNAQQTSTKTIIIVPTQEAEAVTAAAEIPVPVKAATAAESVPPAAVGAVRPAEPKKESGGFMVAKKHVVVKGDTLWDLSRKYYGDPFKWGGIYNANMGTVKNPDLINPADELVIPDTTEEIKPEPAPSPSAAPGAAPATITAAQPDANPVSAAMPAARNVSAENSAPAVTAPGLKNDGKTQEQKLSEELQNFDVTDLSEEMPQDLKEWQTDVKTVPDNWTEDGVITGKEGVDAGDDSLAFKGEIVSVKAADTAVFKPGDVLTSCLKGAAAFDKKGNRLGREIQNTGILEVISVNSGIIKAKILYAGTSIDKGQLVKK